MIGDKLVEAAQQMWASWGGQDDTDDSSDDEKLRGLARQQAEMPLCALVKVLVARQIAGGLLCVGVAIGLLRNLCGINDPVMLLVAMMQCVGPPMINLATMAGLEGDPEAQMQTAKLLLLCYATSVVTWVMWMVAFLHLLQ